MQHLAVYIACAVGALGLYLLVRTRDASVRVIGLIVGLAGLGWLFAQLALAGPEGGDLPDPLFWVFAAIAVAAAVRMVTHHRPVYSALYFVMVVLASAAVFLLLGAEFMAFALIIVYAGAILITYLFVLMLAQQAPTPDEAPESIPVYDLQAREPAAAATVGFLMIAVLSQVIFSGRWQLPLSPPPEALYERAVAEMNLQPVKRERFLERLHAAGVAEDLPETAPVLALSEEAIVFATPGGGEPYLVPLDAEVVRETLAEELTPQNIESVGLALVAKFPVSLELAGVILLLAMFGAVVLARKQIELSESEKRRILTDTTGYEGPGAEPQRGRNGEDEG